MAATTTPPLLYFCIRLFLKIVLKIFYGKIVVENAHLIPGDGEPCIVCANHDNSITDASLLVTSIPLERRSLLRMTAKSTHFGKNSFVGWLIDSLGAIPVKRRVDFGGGQVDNTDAMIKLIEAVEDGEAVGFFPEGVSRYSPTLAPLKSGVARIVSQVLSRNRHKPGFEMNILPCSITYMHRQYFRSNVLVSFQPPLKFRPKDNPELLEPVDYEHIRRLTAQIHERISAGTLHAPSWKILRNAKMAAQLYAPLGTAIPLGDHIRVVKAFLEMFKDASTEKAAPGTPEGSKILQLRNALEEHQTQLSRWRLTDGRVRVSLQRRAILPCLLARLLCTLLLLALCAPGLALWAPVFGAAHLGAAWYRRTGPASETEVRLAHTKQRVGVAAALPTLLGAMVVSSTYSSVGVAVLLVPALAWLTLPWLEDAAASARACIELARMLLLADAERRSAAMSREVLSGHVREFAVRSLGLSEDPKPHFVRAGGGEVCVEGWWSRALAWFSVGGRKEWGETLNFWELANYPHDDSE